MEITKSEFSIGLIGFLVMAFTVTQMLREALLVPALWTASLIVIVGVVLWSWEIPSLLFGHDSFLQKLLEMLTIPVLLTTVLWIWIIGMWILGGGELIRWMFIITAELILVVLGRFMFGTEKRDSLPMLKPALMMFGMLISLPVVLYFGLQPQQESATTSLSLIGIVAFGIFYMVVLIPQIEYEATTLRKEVRRFWLS